MVKFIGVKEARPLALCKQGANQHAHVLMTKALKTPPATTVPENTDMDMKALKAVALMNEVTKAYFVALDDEKAKAFLEKSTDEQAAEALAAKTTADTTAAEAAARATGKSAREMELEKTLATQSGEIAALKAKDEEREIQKRASTEFKGYPGGDDAAVAMLKSFKGLPAETVKNLEAGMLDRIAANKTLTRTIGMDSTEVAKAMPASAKIDAAAKAMAAEKNIHFYVAYRTLADDHSWSETFAAADKETKAAA